MSKIVIALGGNALGNDPESQKKALKHTSKSIVNLIEQGNEIIISHGNGPQVGMINLAMDIASKSDDTVPEMPFPECGAMSQGYIGFHLQNAVQNELRARNMAMPVATIVTQVVVDPNDQSFNNPTKPVGAFYSKEEAEELMVKGFSMKEDAGRGYRRVVPSPKPVDIVEKEVIKTLSDSGAVVISGGGGGIPVIKKDNDYIGVPAVIDKDFTSAKIAELTEADVLVILTAVEKVAISFGKPDEKWLDSMTVEEVEKYIESKEFAEGSMLPKVKAAIEFVTSKPERKALITSLEKAAEALNGKTGTWIIEK